MSNLNRTPVLVGVAQLEQRSRNADEIKEPLTLMTQAVRDAAADGGSSKLLTQAGAVRVVRGIWSYRNPAAAVAQAIGCANAETALTPIGGNCVQSLVNRSALDIAEGRHDIIVITGAEWGYSQARARREGRKLVTREAPGAPDVMIGKDVPMSHDAETALGLVQPIQIYPLFENALRHAQGEPVADHLTRIAALWASFSTVAVDNPHAWIRTPHTAEMIGTISAANRPVSFPYPKLLNSNNNVDQAAALILCSAATATRLGIPSHRWIFPWAGTDAHDHLFVSNRDNLYTSPAIRIAGRRCLTLAGIGPDQLDLIDVYSCFPSAVQIAARELGLSLDRPLTVTGGMTFAGGPLNNYVMHSIARMAELLRERGSGCGLITANGGYLTKHAFGVYGAEAPARPFQYDEPQSEVDALPQRELAIDHTGAATIESYTVLHGPDGAPAYGYIAARTPDQRRAWARVTEPDVLASMADRTRPQEFCGRAIRVQDATAAL